MPTLVPKPGSPTVTQGNLQWRESDALRALVLSWVMMDRESCSLKIRVCWPQYAADGSGICLHRLDRGSIPLLATTQITIFRTPIKCEVISCPKYDKQNRRICGCPQLPQLNYPSEIVGVLNYPSSITLSKTEWLMHSMFSAFF